MKKKMVYNADQLPDSMDETCVEWLLRDHDCNVRLERTENGKVRLRGEWVRWEKVDGEGQDGTGHDWVEETMTRDEIIDIINEVDLVIPDKPVIHLKERFFKKEAK